MAGRPAWRNSVLLPRLSVCFPWAPEVVSVERVDPLWRILPLQSFATVLADV